jgi:hypothetical protein
MEPRLLLSRVVKEAATAFEFVLVAVEVERAGEPSQSRLSQPPTLPPKWTRMSSSNFSVSTLRRNRRNFIIFF